MNKIFGNVQSQCPGSKLIDSKEYEIAPDDMELEIVATNHTIVARSAVVTLFRQRFGL